MLAVVHALSSCWASTARDCVERRGKAKFHLATHPSTPDSIPLDRLREVFGSLSPAKKREAYRKRWALAKKEDPTISDQRWAQEHFWDNYTKVARVLHRMGLLVDSEGTVEMTYPLGSPDPDDVNQPPFIFL